MTATTRGDQLSPPFLDPVPPVWAVRGLAMILLLLSAVAMTAALVVRVPETVTTAFVLVGGSPLRAEMTVPQEATAQVRSGQPVRLFYTAFPYQRYGAQAGTVRAVTPLAGDAGLTVLADLGRETIAVNGEPRLLHAGMTGQARVIVGRRTLFSYVFEPVRAVRENLGR
jgi:membrane fusion protein